MFTDLINQQPKVVKILNKQHKQNRLSHAYLFEGPAGTKKLKAAYYFACMLYCKEEIPCGKCPSCKAILTNKHLNVYYIEPDGQNIKKEQILALQEEFNKSSMINGPRVYIIMDADRMNVASFNSLLKFLEEPLGEQMHAILLTTRPDLILPTIKSRSTIMEFTASNYTLMFNELMENNVFKGYSLVLPYLTSSVEKAMEIAKSQQFISCFTVLIDYLRKLHSKELSLLFYKEHYETLANKDAMKLFVNFLTLLYRDIYNAKLDDSAIEFEEYTKEIKEISSLYQKNDIIDKIDTLIDFEEQLNYNINFDLIFVEVLLKLKGGTIR